MEIQLEWHKTAQHIKWPKSIIIPSYKLIGYWVQPTEQYEKDFLTKYANKFINIHEYENSITRNCAAY